MIPFFVKIIDTNIVDEFIHSHCTNYKSYSKTNWHSTKGNLLFYPQYISGHSYGEVQITSPHKEITWEEFLHFKNKLDNKENNYEIY